MAKYSNKNINTFSWIIYNIYNESEISEKYKILKTNHNEYIINENELEEKVFSIPKIYDELLLIHLKYQWHFYLKMPLKQQSFFNW